MEKIFHSCMIAGTHSGVGKTTWSLALMALARKKGVMVQPFKAGPDYIDTAFHHEFCAPRKSRNLDLFLLSSEYVRGCFFDHSQNADLAIVEGVMGLYDGRKASSSESSSAELAKCLRLPVFLVLDGSMLASSAAAVVLGFKKMDPAVHLAGVFINKVNREGHYKWLKEAIEVKTGIPCFGYLPDDPDLSIPERHLGLTTAAEMPKVAEKNDKAVLWLETHFAWEKFINGCRSLPPGYRTVQKEQPVSCRVSVAYDEAFSFYYEDNFDLLRKAGAEVVFFSPLNDKQIPTNTDFLYLGGGFPEIYAARLSANYSMLESVRSFHETGGLIYGECGGFIYLTEAFVNSEDRKFPFAGLIPGTVRMTGSLQGFGYHEPAVLRDSFLFSAGTVLKSHEFHYSVWENGTTERALYRLGARFDGFADDNLIAGYQHLHFGSQPELITNIIQACGKKQRVYAN